MKLYNIVKVYTSTVGTGTVTLGSAVPSFITFATAGVVNGSTVSYAIEDGNDREVGTGTYTSGAETLTRNVVTSTNSNNLITLSGNAVVFITGLAADLSSDTANVASTLIQRDASGNFAAGAATLSSAVVPLISGGTTASSTLTLQSTSGAGTSDAIIFRTASQLERMRVNTAGDVNIGSANSAGNTLRFFDVYNINTGSSAGAITRLITSDVAGTGTAVGQIIKYKNGTMLFQNSETDSAASMQFYVGASERVRISSSGNVGIGTPSPDALLTVNTIASFGDGAVTTPSIAHKGDLNTGFWFPAADVIAASTAGSERVRIDSSGNVGIGTGSTIRSILNTNVGTVTGPAVTAGLTLSAIYSGVTAVNTIDWNYSGQSAFPVRLGATFNSDGNGMEMVFYTSTAFNATGSERMRLDKDGRLAIGTSTPATSARLEIAGTTGALLVPRLTTTERNALTAVNGMIIYNTTDNQMQGRINGAWVAM